MKIVPVVIKDQDPAEGYCWNIIVEPYIYNSPNPAPDITIDSHGSSFNSTITIELTALSNVTGGNYFFGFPIKDSFSGFSVTK